jgi:uncharacterized protein
MKGLAAAGVLRRLGRRVMTAALVFLLQAYRLLLSPLLGPCCRFAPSCSAYALGALEAHGPWRGAALAARRVLRCHPFHPGGYDPVPLVAQAEASVSSPRGLHDGP